MGTMLALEGSTVIEPAGTANMFTAFEYTNASSLLDYGLNKGLIERTTNGQMIMALLNIKLMTSSEILRRISLEVLMRIVIFFSATSFVKLSIDSDIHDPDTEDNIKGFFMLSVIAHQVVNYDGTNLRTINRSLMALAIILFSMAIPSSSPCENMKRFKQRIKYRLTIDYYLWCLLFAMDLVLTCSSPLHINLEYEFGTELNVSHVMLSSYCVMHLSYSMQMIGNGRLTPLIIGTPLLFLDAGDAITVTKSLFLFIYYLCFWCSDWRELVDWNHSLLCEAGVCNILRQERGDLRIVHRKAKNKFDDWRMEEGLDVDGWFIMLDPPPNQSDRTSLHQTSNTYAHSEDQQAGIEPQIVDYTDRAIYLRSRNPLLASLAAVMIMIWQ